VSRRKKKLKKRKRKRRDPQEVKLKREKRGSWDARSGKSPVAEGSIEKKEESTCLSQRLPGKSQKKKTEERCPERGYLGGGQG